MARADVAIPDSGDWPFTDPKPFCKCGLAACGIAFLVFTVPIWVFTATGTNLGRFALTGGAWDLLRVLILAVGILAAACAVVTRPRSPAVLGLAALAALLALWGMDPDWDTARLVMGLLVFIALFAALLLLLPLLVGKVFAVWEFLFSGHREPDVAAAEVRGRFAGWVLSRVIVVVMVLLHFVGIASAIMSVAPPSRDPSWLANQIFTTYQPYLQFLYLNNAYRFYSPEPGPPTLVWFHIEYADGSTRWFKIPNREIDAKDPLAQEFTRRLSIGESVNQSNSMPNVPERAKARRASAGMRDGIMPHPGMDVGSQYRAPAESSRRLLKDYARYVAQHYPSEQQPDSPVRGVKIYRVIHAMLAPSELAEEGPGRQEPTDPWTYYPAYMGEFTADGEMKDPDDPYLYWIIPIFRWPKGVPVNPLVGQTPISPRGEYEVHDFLETHARLGGLKSEEKQP